MGLGECSTEGGRWSGCGAGTGLRDGRRAALCLVGRRCQSPLKSLNGQLDEWVEREWGPRSRRDAACPRIRFKLVMSPCAADGLPPRINEPAERPAAQAPSLYPEHRDVSNSPACCEVRVRSGVRPRLALRAKVVLARSVLSVGSLRAASTSRDQRERVCEWLATHIHRTCRVGSMARCGAGA